jgi:hypothetical protein
MKWEDSMELHIALCEIAPKCRTCSAEFKEVIQKFRDKDNHQEGGHSLFPATNESSGVINEYHTPEYK